MPYNLNHQNIFWFFKCKLPKTKTFSLHKETSQYETTFQYRTWEAHTKLTVYFGKTKYLLLYCQLNQNE